MNSINSVKAPTIEFSSLAEAEAYFKADVDRRNRRNTFCLGVRAFVPGKARQTDLSLANHLRRARAELQKGQGAAWSILGNTGARVALLVEMPGGGVHVHAFEYALDIGQAVKEALAQAGALAKDREVLAQAWRIVRRAQAKALQEQLISDLQEIHLHARLAVLAEKGQLREWPKDGYKLARKLLGSARQDWLDSLDKPATPVMSVQAVLAEDVIDNPIVLAQPVDEVVLIDEDEEASA